ncbi:MAG TPA: MmoB/DmpM family protein [Fibrobacteria bacterium]|nr:MmoB/DmpM family protein [Fibrobacteria bacterium]
MDRPDPGNASGASVTAKEGSGAIRGPGPVLIAGEASQAVLEAMKSLNRNLSVLDRGSYWRVSSASGCRLTRAAVEKRLGKPFLMPGDLEALMPSFSGRFRVTEEEARWEEG